MRSKPSRPQETQDSRDLRATGAESCGHAWGREGEARVDVCTELDPRFPPLSHTGQEAHSLEKQNDGSELGGVPGKVRVGVRFKTAILTCLSGLLVPVFCTLSPGKQLQASLGWLNYPRETDL